MKTKYYEYNRKSDGEKYSEFTEAEYLTARKDENRWFISFGDSVLECEESEYRKYFSEKNHSDYVQRDRQGKKVVPILLEQYTYNDSDNVVVGDSAIVPFEEQILDKISAEQYALQLKKVMENLKPNEREIIYQIFWNKKSQSELARNYGISQQTMNEKVNRILAKMLKIMKSEK